MKIRKFFSPDTVSSEGGRTVTEAHAQGVQWIGVDFTKAMRIAWNWDDLLQNAMAPEENLNLTCSEQ